MTIFTADDETEEAMLCKLQCDDNELDWYGEGLTCPMFQVSSLTYVYNKSHPDIL